MRDLEIYTKVTLPSGKEYTFKNVTPCGRVDMSKARVRRILDMNLQHARKAMLRTFDTYERGMSPEQIANEAAERVYQKVMKETKKGQ